MISVFISHNYMDKPLARKISNTLNCYGIKTWIDESEIKVGDSLIEKIRKGIDNVDYLIALISKYSVESEWVLKELDIAMNKEIEGKKVIVLPILAGKCELPGFLKGKLYLDMSSTRNFSKNLPQLLSRFNIENVLSQDDFTFTSKQLTLLEIIQKLSSVDKKERATIWKNFTYSDEKIFELAEFKNFLLDYLEKETRDDDELLEIIKVNDRYAKGSGMLETYYLSLLDTPNLTLLDAVIRSIIKFKITSLELTDKIIALIENESEDKKILIYLKYFGSVRIYDENPEELFDLCNVLLNEKREKKFLCSITRIIFLQFQNDMGIRKIIELWNKADEIGKREIIKKFAELGSNVELNSIYIRSPRLRDKFKEIILKSFSEDDDLFNADLLCALFISDELSNIFSKNEMWDITNAFDDYSIIAFTEKLSIDYNVTTIFSSNEDVNHLSKFLERQNSNIDEYVFDILSDIQLKSAIDVLVSTKYEPKYYNVTNIIITLVKETNINNYLDFYLVCKNVQLQNCDEVEKILLLLCDYLIDNSKVAPLISSLQADNIKKSDLGLRCRRRNLRFICDILDKEIASFSDDEIRKIKHFNKKVKSLLNE